MDLRTMSNVDMELVEDTTAYRGLLDARAMLEQIDDLLDGRYKAQLNEIYDRITEIADNIAKDSFCEATLYPDRLAEICQNFDNMQATYDYIVQINGVKMNKRMAS